MKNLFLAVFLSLLLLSSPAHAASAPDSPVAYELPYPGILPNSPFYPLKALRDKISAFFISDPVKKARFDLSLADTRISAALALIERKNLPLAESTISKAQNYFEEALTKTRQAKNQGIDTQELVKKLATAAAKHNEVIVETQKELNPIEKTRFKQVFNRSKKLIEQLSKME